MLALFSLVTQIEARARGLGLDDVEWWVRGAFVPGEMGGTNWRPIFGVFRDDSGMWTLIANVFCRMLLDGHLHLWSWRKSPRHRLKS